MITARIRAAATVATALLVSALYSGTAARSQSPTPSPTPRPAVCAVVPKSEANPSIKPSRYKGKLYKFCCLVCKGKFDRNPARFVKGQ